VITLTYQTVDGVDRTKKYKTLVGAQKFAQEWVGVRPEVFKGSLYAVSADGIGVMYWSGINPEQLWPSAFA